MSVLMLRRIEPGFCNISIVVSHDADSNVEAGTRQCGLPSNVELAQSPGMGLHSKPVRPQLTDESDCIGSFVCGAKCVMGLMQTSVSDIYRFTPGGVSGPHQGASSHFPGLRDTYPRVRILGK